MMIYSMEIVVSKLKFVFMIQGKLLMQLIILKKSGIKQNSVKLIYIFLVLKSNF